ncbi:zinc finger protein 227 [Salmo salar]|uniref:Zinc finger protein 227 n=1 Tax=Salmo salar TaxID=8030 RepID=A0A1S3P7F8_SALSA|nr:zinc finger protein 227-like [Salmo salar]|eukprot:XP_014023525.1 PREDICTED: zinc finger protein 227-like [Salmo salar]
MSKMQLLNMFLRERLTAAAVEIFGVVEKTIVEYQEEITRSKEENERLQKMLDMVIKPQVKLHRADPRQHHVSEEEVPLEQEWRRENSELTESTEEQDLRTNLGEEQMQGPETHGHNIEFGFTPPCVKGDFVQDPWPSHLFQTQIVEDNETNNLSSTLVEHIKTEPDGGEDYGVLTSDPQLMFAVNAHCSAAPSENMHGTEIGGPLQRKTKTGRPFRHIGTLSELKKRRALYERFRCHVCGKGFPARNGLGDHMTTHTGERPHSCHLCGKGFKVKSHLKEHIRVHTGEKPFVCPVCGKAFRQDAHMKGHLRGTHKEKPYRCHDCGESFSQMGEMQVHRTVCCGPIVLGPNLM